MVAVLETSVLDSCDLNEHIRVGRHVIAHGREIPFFEKRIAGLGRSKRSENWIGDIRDDFALDRAIALAITRGVFCAHRDNKFALRSKCRCPCKGGRRRRGPHSNVHVRLGIGKSRGRLTVNVITELHAWLARVLIVTRRRPANRPRVRRRDC